MVKKAELKIHGFNACMSVFKHRPEAVIRAYLLQSRLKTFGDLVKMCVRERKAYHVMSAEELADVSGATHHEGICLVIRLPHPLTASELQARAKKAGQWLALEDVGNPHNLGAIMRSAAHFGVQGVFLINPKAAWETGAFYRTAEGGAEAVPLIPVESVDELLALAHELGLSVHATTGHQGIDLYQTTLPKKVIFLMGAEGPGLSLEALKKVSSHVRIPGTGAVESLNVAAASTAVMGEWFRQNFKS